MNLIQRFTNFLRSYHYYRPIVLPPFWEWQEEVNGYQHFSWPEEDTCFGTYMRMWKSPHPKEGEPSVHFCPYVLSDYIPLSEDSSLAPQKLVSANYALVDSSVYQPLTTDAVLKFTVDL